MPKTNSPYDPRVAEFVSEAKDPEERARRERIACRILTLAQSDISVNMRYLNPAIFRLPAVPGPFPLATDGNWLYYTPEYLIDEFRKDRNVIVRNYMHVILHCVFQHSFVHDLVDRKYWDLACDIAVEDLIASFRLPCFSVERETRQRRILLNMFLPFKEITAEKLYRYFLENKPSAGEYQRLCDLFHVDDHDLWYLPPDPDEEQKPPVSKNSNQSGDVDPSDLQPGVPRPDAEQQWKDISRQIQMDMESRGRTPGQETGDMLTSLKKLHRERYDYRKFLQKFAVLGEQVMINDDEFDNIFYTYGLELYGDMPLVEPLEYKEVKRIRDFVIAVDTSASTSGDLVQRFIQKTYNVLKTTESFFSHINVYVVQADMDIQTVTEIHDPDLLDETISNLKLKGQGGTDFRPVFAYVNQLREQQKFQNLKGILYFTDGYGPFPKTRPPYDAAFCFIRNEYDDPPVPPWAIKLVLEEEEL